MALFQKITYSPTADVATNGTITLAYPSGLSSSNVVTASGALMYVKDQSNMYAQGASNFSVAYGGSIVITYLGATTIKAGYVLDFYVPTPLNTVKLNDHADPQVTIPALTDSTGGTPATTLAAITAGAGYAQADMVAVKNAISQLAVSHAAIKAALTAAGITA